MNKKHQKPFSGVKNAGFTLIELLVVVLIIGILSSVALPQYQKAVLKARMAGAIPIAKSIKDNLSVFYLSEGRYPTNAEFKDSILDFGNVSCSSDICRVGDYLVNYLTFSSYTRAFAVYAPGSGFSCTQTEAIGAGVYIGSDKTSVMVCAAGGDKAKAICRGYSAAYLMGLSNASFWGEGSIYLYQM